MGLGEAVEEAVASNGDQWIETGEAIEAVEPEVPPVPASSVLAAVRSRAQQLQAEHTVDLPLPGYEGVLVGRYRSVSLPRLWGKGGNFRNPLGEEWGIGADALAGALVGLYGVTAGEQLVPLYESDDPARYDDDLVAAMGLHPKGRNARAVMVALLGQGDDQLGESRIWSHFMAYQGWLVSGSAQEVADQAVGEPAPLS